MITEKTVRAVANAGDMLLIDGDTAWLQPAGGGSGDEIKMSFRCAQLLVALGTVERLFGEPEDSHQVFRFVRKPGGN